MIAFTPLIGRFGNQLFQYAYARALCEKNGWTLSTPAWVGEKIFGIPQAMRCDNPDKTIGGYAQNQTSLDHYSRKWVKKTLVLRPEIQEKLDTLPLRQEVVAHRRVGDYLALNYPVVSENSYYSAAKRIGYYPHQASWASEEAPWRHVEWFTEFQFILDFYRMMRAKVLFRGNSSFSFWAGALGEARIFSPCIKGKPGGVESDCEFSEGNHEKLAELPDLTDLHMFKNEDLYDYPLTEESSVIVVGGYLGDFTAEIRKRFNCFVNVWEPCKEFAQKLRERFQGHPDVLISEAALGGSCRIDAIGVKGSMTGFNAEGPKQKTDVADIAGLWIAHEQHDLLHLNCEGAEFEILERILERDMAKLFNAIAVQFHPVVPNAAERYAKIREGLLKTHFPTFQEPWTWEGLELRQ